MARDWVFDQKMMMMMETLGQDWDRVNTEQASMYLNLIVEELGETLCAANPMQAAAIKASIETLKVHAKITPDHDIVEVLDGLIDVHAVTLGAGISLNLPMDKAWHVVFKTNIAKVDPQTGRVRRREDGKVLKPEGWVAPTESLIDLLYAEGRIGKSPA